MTPAAAGTSTVTVRPRDHDKLSTPVTRTYTLAVR
ncbi:MAG: hypothetical protein K0R62_1814 [Nonomuraea muscovyensis]|jgi:hypothetical protein|nr:hypothetical protein [Nonomuraea muscovyensis]